MSGIATMAGILVWGWIGLTQQRPPQFDMSLKTVKLTDSLYVLEGAGGNVAGFVGDSGVLLVDDSSRPRLRTSRPPSPPSPRSRSASW